MLVSYTLRLGRECNACKISVPVNGLVPAVRCYHCREVNELDAGFWAQAMPREHFAQALGFDEGDGTESKVISGRGNYVIAYGKRSPRCQACKGPDLELAALAGAAAAGGCACPQCGRTIRVREADELVRRVEPHARWLVHETVSAVGDPAIESATQPMLFACLGCGGGLKVDGASRSVACQYCGSSNYLPDGLWEQFHPVPKPTVFFLVCDYDEASMRALRWTEEEARVRDAGSAALGPDGWRQLARDRERTVRYGVAANAAVPGEILELLVGDDSSDVRVGLARNLGAPAELLLRLAADGDSAVTTALIVRSDLPAAVCEQLAAHCDDDVRQRIALHANLSHATLFRLAGDSDDDVKAAARRRLRALREQGVNVDAGRGFFQRLFGP